VFLLIVTFIVSLEEGVDTEIWGGPPCLDMCNQSSQDEYPNAFTENHIRGEKQKVIYLFASGDKISDANQKG